MRRESIKFVFITYNCCLGYSYGPKYKGTKAEKSPSMLLAKTLVGTVLSLSVARVKKVKIGEAAQMVDGRRTV